jgi:hypothetical protein
MQVEAERPTHGIEREKCVGGTIFECGPAFIGFAFDPKPVVAIRVKRHLPDVSGVSPLQTPKAGGRGILTGSASGQLHLNRLNPVSKIVGWVVTDRFHFHCVLGKLNCPHIGQEKRAKFIKLVRLARNLSAHLLPTIGPNAETKYGSTFSEAKRIHLVRQVRPQRGSKFGCAIAETPKALNFGLNIIDPDLREFIEQRRQSTYIPLRFVVPFTADGKPKSILAVGILGEYEDFRGNPITGFETDPKATDGILVEFNHLTCRMDKKTAQPEQIQRSDFAAVIADEQPFAIGHDADFGFLTIGGIIGVLRQLRQVIRRKSSLAD